MTDHEKRIREALEAGPTEGEWEAWTGGKSRYGITGPSAAACHSAQQGVRDCQVTADLPCVQIASSGSKAPALAFGDNESEAKANARLIAACNPAAIRALLADLDAMRAKAARYDYLSERLVGVDFDWNESGVQVLVFKVEPGTEVWATADETIDGAIAALKGASHE